MGDDLRDGDEMRPREMTMKQKNIMRYLARSPATTKMVASACCDDRAEAVTKTPKNKLLENRASQSLFFLECRGMVKSKKDETIRGCPSVWFLTNVGKAWISLGRLDD